MITSDDIRSQRFTTQLVWGLSRAEVLAFLQDVADAYEALEGRNASLLQRVVSLTAKVQASSARPSSAEGLESRCDPEADAASMVGAPHPRETAASPHIEMFRAAALREVEALLHDAQAQAQSVIEGAKEQQAAIVRDAEDARARLQLEADGLIASAMAKAESLGADARDQEGWIRAEIERLDRSRVQLVDDIRERLGTYHQWLATLEPPGRAAGGRNGDPPNRARDSVESIDEAGSA